jgi:hypothetical protein
MSRAIVKKQKNPLPLVFLSNLTIELAKPFLKQSRKHPSLGIASVCHGEVLDSYILETPWFCRLADDKRI